MRKPRFYNSAFGEKVKQAYKKGMFTTSAGEIEYWDNRKVTEWEIKENGGILPSPRFNIEEIVDYYNRNK
nr:MAG TPA: hypothetical protein [Caudoviricetes sp.]